MDRCYGAEQTVHHGNLRHEVGVAKARISLELSPQMNNTSSRTCAGMRKPSGPSSA